VLIVKAENIISLGVLFMDSLDRRNNLLKIIVEEYARSALPVSSGFIVEKYFKNLSSATIRNDMAELEASGLICQPHISAGRIPTIEGYKEYLAIFVDNGEITKAERAALDKIAAFDLRQKIKEVAKVVADLANNAVFVGFGKDDYFYTGLANLFRQPEFRESAYLYDMSEIIDHLGEGLTKINGSLESDQVKILVGSDNPFGEFSSVIIARYGHHRAGLIGLLGPNRLDYKQGLGLISYAQGLLIN